MNISSSIHLLVGRLMSYCCLLTAVGQNPIRALHSIIISAHWDARQPYLFAPPEAYHTTKGVNGVRSMWNMKQTSVEGRISTRCS